MLQWTPGHKHPETPAWIFKNVWFYDKVRSTVQRRCAFCTFAISTDDEKCKQVMGKCGNKECACAKTISDTLHYVCEVCYDMWHALYFNAKLKNQRYFRNLDDEDFKHRNDGDEGRKRMGLQ